VALLQVAQTIVSFNELNDVLSSITRLTPILIGAKRILIYIWNENLETFLLSQTYGVSHKELNYLAKTVHPYDFPLLSMLRLSNCAVALEITPEIDSPLVWSAASLDQIRIIATSPMEEIDSEYRLDIKNILISRKPLLYGLPLVIKGSLMGVMLIQEVENPKFTSIPRTAETIRDSNRNYATDNSSDTK
jgi:hypothetical protein